MGRAMIRTAGTISPLCFYRPPKERKRSASVQLTCTVSAISTPTFRLRPVVSFRSLSGGERRQGKNFMTANRPVAAQPRQLS
jgi:hypothetical protein